MHPDPPDSSCQTQGHSQLTGCHGRRTKLVSLSGLKPSRRDSKGLEGSRTKLLVIWARHRQQKLSELTAACSAASLAHAVAEGNSCGVFDHCTPKLPLLQNLFASATQQCINRHLALQTTTCAQGAGRSLSVIPVSGGPMPSTSSETSAVSNCAVSDRSACVAFSARLSGSAAPA